MVRSCVSLKIRFWIVIQIGLPTVNVTIFNFLQLLGFLFLLLLFSRQSLFHLEPFDSVIVYSANGNFRAQSDTSLVRQVLLIEEESQQFIVSSVPIFFRERLHIHTPRILANDDSYRKFWAICYFAFSPPNSTRTPARTDLGAATLTIGVRAMA